jgi:hypothetical protein
LLVGIIASQLREIREIVLELFGKREGFSIPDKRAFPFKMSKSWIFNSL